MSFAPDDDEAAQEAHDNRIRRCDCGARIIWFTTKTGKKMPVDADTVEVGDEEYDPPRHHSHFAICPNAAKHRRPR